MPRKEKKKYHYLYKTTCAVNGRFYYGIHSTSNLEDGYLGSGIALGKSIRKYGKEAHTKEIIEFFETREELCAKEAEVVNEDLLKNGNCMNLILGGGGLQPAKGTPAYEKMFGSDVQRKRQGKGQISQRRLRQTDPEWTERVFQKNSAAQRKRVEEGRNDFAAGKIWLGKKHRSETRSKMSASHRANGDQQGSKNSQWGTSWIHHPELKVNKKVPQDEVDSFLALGWIRGRKMKLENPSQEVLH